MFRTSLAIVVGALLLDLLYVVVVEPRMYVRQVHLFNQRYRNLDAERNFSSAECYYIKRIAPLDQRWRTFRIQEPEDLLRLPNLCSMHFLLTTWHDRTGRNEISSMVRDMPRPDRVTEAYIDLHDLNKWPVSDLRKVLSWPNLKQLSISSRWNTYNLDIMTTLPIYEPNQQRLKESQSRITRMRPIVEEWHAALVAANYKLPQEVEWNFQDRVSYLLQKSMMHRVFLPRPKGYLRPPRPVPDLIYYDQE